MTATKEALQSKMKKKFGKSFTEEELLVLPPLPSVFKDDWTMQSEKDSQAEKYIRESDLRGGILFTSVDL